MPSTPFSKSSRLAPGGKHNKSLVKLVGDKELQKAMAQLRTRSKRNKVTRSAVRAATKPLRTVMKATAPVQPGGKGELKRSIRSVFRTGEQGVYSITGPEFRTYLVNGKPVNPAKYVWMVEYGVSPHKIAAKKRVLSDGSTVYGSVISHPGFAGRGFMRRAYDQTKAISRRILMQKTYVEIKKEVAKLNAKYGKAGRL